MSLIDGEPNRRSSVIALEAAWLNSTKVTAKKDTAQKVTAKPDTVQDVIAKEDPIHSEISEVLEILRRPLPSDSLLEFIVSEDGYKKIIEERENSNRKWNVSQSHNHLHEHTYGERRKNSAARRRCMRSPYLENTKDWKLDNLNKLSQKWWIEQKKATVEVLLCLTEVDKSSGAAHGLFRTMEDSDTEIRALNSTDNGGRSIVHWDRWNIMSTNGLETLRDAFFETYRETDAGIVKSEPVYLIKDGVDVSEEMPRDLSAIKPQTFMEDVSDAILITTLNRLEDTFEVEEY
ncbi:hypothetical protein V1522DRAFT_424372 [Lipomyces starkeyi]